MKYWLFNFAFGILGILLLGGFSQTFACTCVPSAPCQSFGRSDVVFVGKVVGSKHQKTSEEYETVDEGKPTERMISKKVIYDVGEIYFEVAEAFQGTEIGARITINSNTGGGDCSFWFKRGETYAVFASKENSTAPSGISSLTYGGSGEQLKPKAMRLWTTICSGTREIKYAEDTLSYLKNLPEIGSGGTIVGRIDESIKDYSDENLAGKPLANTQILAKQIDGEKKTFYGTSDQNGYYEINVPVGNYLVTPVLKPNLMFESQYSEDDKQITIEDRKCDSKIFWVTNDSKISGKVVDAEGKIAGSISLDLIPFGRQREERTFSRIFEYVSEDGLFEFKGVPLGSYQISINYTDEPDEDAPFPTFFYPNTENRGEAKVFEIDLGTKFTDLVFQLPPKLIKRKITGTVVWKNGKPAVGAEVQLIDVEFDRDVFFKEPMTNKKGEFSTEWFEGRQYKIKVIVWKKSPGGQSGFGIADAETEVFTLDNETSAFKIVLNTINPDEKSVTRKTVRSPL